MKNPGSPSEITLEWLIELLGWKEQACAPVAIEVDPDFGNASLLGRIARVKLKYENATGKPDSVIVKFQSRASDRLREARIYRLLSEAGIRSVPGLLGVFDEQNLVLENIPSVQDGKGITIERAYQVLSLLAGIHGAFWNDPRVPAIPSEKFAGVIEFRMGQSWKDYKDRYRDKLGSRTEDFEWIWKNAGKVSAHRLCRPSTLFHGDVHMGNLLFSADNGKGPFLTDWQLAGQGLGGNDVSRLLVGCLTVDQRRGTEKCLLEHYYGSLPETVRAGYSFEHFFLNYCACATRTMMTAVMAVGPLFSTLPDQFKIADDCTERVLAALEDLEPVKAYHELEERGWLT